MASFSSIFPLNIYSWIDCEARALFEKPSQATDAVIMLSFAKRYFAFTAILFTIIIHSGGFFYGIQRILRIQKKSKQFFLPIDFNHPLLAKRFCLVFPISSFCLSVRRNNSNCMNTKQHTKATDCLTIKMQGKRSSLFKVR